MESCIGDAKGHHVLEMPKSLHTNLEEVFSLKEKNSATKIGRVKGYQLLRDLLQALYRIVANHLDS